MIAKMAKGKGARGVLQYALADGKKASVIDSNMASSTPRAIAREMGAIRRLRPTLGKAVMHTSLSAAPGERLTDEQWREITRQYLDGMGFADSQYIAVRHGDTEHDHIHIVANRITMSGDVVSDSQDWRRQESIMREIERAHGLQPVAPSRQAAISQPTSGEVRESLRTGAASARLRLQAICAAAARGAGGIGDYIERLEAAGVTVTPTLQQGGTKLSGLLYNDGEGERKGSDLGTRYTPKGLANAGVTYEHNRDLAAASRAAERGAARAPGATDRAGEAISSAERRGSGAGARAPGPVDGHAGDRDPADPGRYRSRQPAAGRAVDQADQRGGGSSPAGRGGAGSSRPSAGDQALPAGLPNGRAGGSARQRIVDLAKSAAGRPDQSGRPGRGPVPGPSAAPVKQPARAGQAVQGIRSLLRGVKKDLDREMGD